MDVTLCDLFNILDITSGTRVNLKSKKPFDRGDILDISYQDFGNIPLFFAACRVIKVTVGFDTVTITIDW